VITLKLLEIFRKNTLIIFSLGSSLYFLISYVLFSPMLDSFNWITSNNSFEFVMLTIFILTIITGIRTSKESIYGNIKYKINVFKQSKSIILLLIPIIIFLYVISYIPDILLSINNWIGPLWIIEDKLIRYVLTGFVLLPLLFYIGFFFNKDFYFYSAKYFLDDCKQNQDNINQINNLVNAIYLYNTYLKKTIKFQINDIQKICSKIISDGSINLVHVIELISNAFDEDKLSPIKYISQFIGSDKVLIKETRAERLKNFSSIFIPIITVLVSIIAIFFN
jgi:hypothetical protein